MRAALTPILFARPSTSAAPAPLISAINGAFQTNDTGGWSATWASGTPPTFTPDSAPVTFTVSRPGFDTSGSATTYTDTITYTQRVRQAYPSQASLTTNIVALSDVIYSTDTVAGVTNNSPLTSPLPIANWCMPHRLTVGNTVNLEVVAFHRNARGGKQVACVKFIGTDGTTTVSQIVSAAVISNRSGDQHAVITAACALDLSTLTDVHLITCNAEIYPWIGGAASVAKSATTSVVSGSLERAFSPRYFYKNTTILATPTYAYVASTGSDTTGVASTTAATAAATPCLTVVGAINKINASAGKVDGGIVRVVDTVNLGTSPAGNMTQNAGCVTVTRAPGTAKAAAIVTLGASMTPKIGYAGVVSPLTAGALYFTDLTFVRSGSFLMNGQAANPLEMIFDSVAFDGGSANAAYMGTFASSSHYGTTFTNLALGTLNPAAPEHRIFRGCTGAPASTNIEGWLHLGNSWTTPGVLSQFGQASTPPTRTSSGMIAAFNVFTKAPSATGVIDIGATEDISNVAIVQNLFEVCHTTTSQFGIRNMGDTPAIGNSSHILFHNNTVTGFWDVGRNNDLYDNTVGTIRQHKLQSFVGNLLVQFNIKGDVFTSDGTHVGNWSAMYGCGFQGEWTQWVDANSQGIGGSFAPAYPGLGSSFGTSATVPHAANAAIWTNYQGTTNTGTTPVAGLGSGTYTTVNGAPVRGIVASAVLPFDLAGVARSTTADTAGAYA